MPTSANVQNQSAAHPFENIEYDLDAGFDLFDEADKGTKNADGSITFNQVADDNKDDNKETPVKKTTIADVDDTNDSKYDEFIDGGDTSDDDGGDVDDDKNKNADNKKPAQAATDDDTNPNKVFYDMMVAAGHWKEFEGFDGTEESFEKAREFNMETLREEDLDEYFDTAFEKNPDGKVYGKALLQHLVNGGRIADFQAVYSQDEISVDDLDNEDKATAEETATAMLREYYGDKMKPERLSAFIKEKKTKGLLIDSAKDIAPDFDELREENKKALAENQKANAIKAKDNARNYQKSVIDLTNSQETVGHLTIGKTPKERKAVADYMLQPSVEMQNGNKTSQFVADLNELRGNPEWNIVLAKTALDFKNKKPAAADKADNKKPSTTQTIKEILEKNKKPISSASSENIETPTRQAVRKAWDGIGV